MNKLFIISALIVLVILFGVVMAQIYVVQLSLQQVYSDLASRTATVKFEVNDLHNVANNRLSTLEDAVKKLGSDSAEQEGYTQQQIDSVTDSLSDQRKMVRDLTTQVEANQEAVATLVSQAQTGQEAAVEFAPVVQAALDSIEAIEKRLGKIDMEIFHLTDMVEQQDNPDQQAAGGEEDYYRALYDICVSAVASEVGAVKARASCLETADEFRQKGWYEQDSPGWQWQEAIAGPGL